jgi:cytochrome c-type biogenesis protein CcmH
LTSKLIAADVLTACVLSLLLVGGAVATFAASAKTSVQEVSEGLTCQCGCGLTVANCNHPQCESSLPMREQIEKMIAQGMGRAQIIAFFRARYGEKILSAPTIEGFDLLAWIIPFAAVFAGCFIIIGAISRWRANQNADSTTWEDAALSDDPELRRQLEREIQERC